MSRKFKVVVSDLHLGAGHAGHCNPLEDFDRDQAFSDFLAEIIAESETERAAVELILNGDIFEMLQVPHVDSFDPKTIYPPQSYRSFSEANSIQKLDLIVEGHRQFFDALARFVHDGGSERKITFVKGNHDLDLYWPAMKHRIRQAIAQANGKKRELVAFEEWRYCDEGIYVEHGNQYEGLINRVPSMIDLLGGGNPAQIRVPPGSRFIIDVLNQVERDTYWVDGIKPVTALIWYSLIYDFGLAARAVAALLRGIPGMVDGILFARGISEQELVMSLEDPEQVRDLSRQYLEDPGFRIRFDSLVRRLLNPLLEPSLQSSRSVSRERLNAMDMAAHSRRDLWSALYRAALQVGQANDVSIVVFGHTHQPVHKTSSETGITYFNSGTWTWYADFGEQGPDRWEELFSHPERFTGSRKLSYVRIDYTRDGQPSGTLREYQSPRCMSIPQRIQSWFLPEHQANGPD